MGDNHSFQHITNNFSLYGFSNPKTGCLQAVKELLDNAIDALHEAASAGQTGSGRIILLIAAHDSKPNCVVLECEDNGCGMSNPEKVNLSPCFFLRCHTPHSFLWFSCCNSSPHRKLATTQVAVIIVPVALEWDLVPLYYTH